jgi:hypothetical protein
MHFCLARSVVMETGVQASDLAEFTAALTRVPASSLYYHLFETRFTGGESDFAMWIDTSLGRSDLARRVADIDPYMFSLEQARRKLLAIVSTEVSS